MPPFVHVTNVLLSSATHVSVTVTLSPSIT
jgi:hypothetical protein